MSVYIKISSDYNYLVTNPANNKILAIMPTLINSIAFCRQSGFVYTFNF